MTVIKYPDKYPADTHRIIEGRKETKNVHLTADTPEEFREKYERWQHKLDVGVTGAITVAEYSERWLADLREDMGTEASYAMYPSMLKNYILPVIGNYRLDSVTTGDCNRVMRKASGRAPSTVKKLKTVLCSLIGSAYDDELISKDPTDRVKMPKNVKREEERRPITAEERSAFLAVCRKEKLRDGKPNYGAGFYMLMLCCGLRPGEVCALEKSAINWNTKIIRVVKAKEKGPGYHEKEPKGGRQRHTYRNVPMTKEFAEWFKMWLDAHPTLPECPYVFAQRDRMSPITDSVLKRRWETYRQYIDIELGAQWRYKTEPGHRKKYFEIVESRIADDFTPYLFRHTYGTLLAEAGVPQLQLAAIMGHSSTKTTEKYYIHRTEQMIKEGQARLEAYMETHAELALPDIADWAISKETKENLYEMVENRKSYTSNYITRKRLRMLSTEKLTEMLGSEQNDLIPLIKRELERRKSSENQ